jgi:hypothetical protein
MATRSEKMNGDRTGVKASGVLDDKYSLVINLVFLSNSEQVIIFAHNEIKESIADVFC